jgi:hypothetical protein
MLADFTGHRSIERPAAGPLSVRAPIATATTKSDEYVTIERRKWKTRGREL